MITLDVLCVLFLGPVWGFHVFKLNMKDTAIVSLVFTNLGYLTNKAVSGSASVVASFSGKATGDYSNTPRALTDSQE